MSVYVNVENSEVEGYAKDELFVNKKALSSLA